MFYRKDAAVALAVCAMLASGSLAVADEAKPLTLDSSVVNLQDAAPRGLLMGGLDQVGAAKSLDAIGLNIYGWVEGGYTVNLRRQSESSKPGVFTREPGNHFEFNQLDLRFERLVDMKKFDVGGMVEILFGTDSNYIRSNGIEYQTPGDNPGEVPQFEIPQAYVDVAIPVGNGLKVRVGKFATLLGYETIAPVTNPFYTHSYLFGAIPFTQTGVMAFYSLNDQWAVAGGITRGWDQATEDVNGAPDFLGQISYTPSKRLSVLLNTSVGPQDVDDTGHYRVTVNPVVSYKLTERLTIAADGLYTYDGGMNAGNYGDQWGLALYAGYALSDMFTLNARIEKFHDYSAGNFFGATNYYEITLGLTITPMPKDRIGSNLKIRPELRYDYSDYINNVFPAGAGHNFEDQWTAACDVIFTF